MSISLPIIEARNKLTQIADKLERKPQLGAITVTRRGKPVLAVMSWELYDSLIETLEILSDEELMKSIRQGIKEAKEGKTHTMEEVKKELGL